MAKDLSKIILFNPGSGRSDKASFSCSKKSVPAAVITRIQREVKEEKPGNLERFLITRLAKYQDLLDALDKQGVSYADAFEFMSSLKPRGASGAASPRVGKEAAAVASALCRKYSGMKAAEMFDKFMETAQRPEFKAKVIALIQEKEASFGRNAAGRIRVRAEREGMAAIAAKARKAQKKRR